VVAALAIAVPEHAAGQKALLTSSLTLAEEYDDNVTLSSTKPQSDFLTVARPGLQLEVTDEAWTLALRLLSRAEKFARRSDLDNAGEQWDANGVLQFRATPNLQTSLTASLVRSLDAGQADPDTGITQGRFTTLSTSLTAAANYQIDQRTSVGSRAGYRLLTSDSPQSRNSETRELGASLQRQFDARNAGVLRYSFSQFVFDRSASATTATGQAGATDSRDGEQSQSSHSGQLGLLHTWSPTVQLSWSSGLSLLERADGTQDAVWNSSQRYNQQFRDVTLSASYDRSVGVAGVIGGAGVNQVVALTSSWAATAWLAVTVDLRVTDVQTRGETSDTHIRTYGGTLRVAYRILSWLTIHASYRHSTQSDLIRSSDVQRNIFSIELTASKPQRVY
jgi:hypothetical protein